MEVQGQQKGIGGEGLSWTCACFWCQALDRVSGEGSTEPLLTVHSNATYRVATFFFFNTQNYAQC